MDARLGAMIEKEGDDDYDLVSAIYEANVASTPRCCVRWRPELVGRSVRGLPDAHAACDAVQIVESAGPYVSVRYDRVMNGLEHATQIPQKACAAHGRPRNCARLITRASAPASASPFCGLRALVPAAAYCDRAGS